MLEAINPAFRETNLKTWLFIVHQEIYKESDTWEKSEKNLFLMDKLIEKMESGGLPEEEQSELYTTINECKFQAADIAYILGLRHGMDLKEILEKGGKITDLLEN